MHTNATLRTIAIPVLLAIVTACAGGGPTSPRTDASNAGPIITGTIVDEFTGQGVSQARIAHGDETAVAGVDGRFTIRATSANGPHAVRVTVDGYHPRETFLAGSGVRIGLAPASFEMPAFDDMGREKESQTIRWVSNPVIHIDPNGHAIPVDADLATWVREAAESVPVLIREWTDGALSPASLSTRGDLPAAGTPGTLIIVFDENPASYPNDRAVGVAKIYRGSNRVISAAVVRLRFSKLTGSSAVFARKAMLAHELGHALGLSHMDGPTKSIMEPIVRSPVLTAFDRSAGSLLYDRAPGNMTIDRDDLAGYRASLQGASAVTTVEEVRCTGELDLDSFLIP